MSDRALGEKHGVSQSAVSQRRSRMGIDPFQAFRWESVDLREMAKTMTDGEIGKKYGVVSSAVCNARTRLGIPSSCLRRGHRTDWDRQPLGEVPDKTLAKALGVPNSSVSDARRSRGIPKFTKESAAAESFATQSVYKSRKRRKNGRDSHHGERAKVQEANEAEGSWVKVE
jgi:hypothetical protein